MEELSKNKLVALSNKTQTTEESKGYFIKGYYYEFQTREELEQTELEAIETSTEISDIYPNQ